ncbi:MAG TPA: MFS transporter [Armatimonadota bacterium]
MAAGKQEGGLYWRLSLMMFLEFAVWGAWSVMIATHMDHNLHFDGKHISYVFGTTAFGALLSPMIAGYIADRVMPNQIFTAISHLVGAALLFVAWKQTQFWPLEITMIAYAFTYMPTIALTNAIAFHHMKDSNKFGMIRMWGSIGWILVQMGLAAYLNHWRLLGGAAVESAHAADCFIFAAVAAVLMSVYCLTLPNTPPSKNAKNPYAFLEALKLARNRNFLILLVISFIVAIELPFYYNLTLLYLTEPMKLGGVGLTLDRGQFVMTYGQIGEIAMMALLYPLMRKGGVKWTIFLGILAWPVRYAIFAYLHQYPSIVVAALPLHGICYAFFFAGGMMAVERIAHRDIRASAQGLMVFATNGLGMLVGHFVSGRVHDFYRTAEGGHNWAGIFMIPIVVTVVAGIIFLLAFNEKQFSADSAKVKAEDAALEATPVPAA